MTKVWFILGCTACGKGTVGRQIARRTGGQIVSVDSMKVYRRMDIGTAKPSRKICSEIPHHCIDIVEPSEAFSAARYVSHADEAINKIAAAGAVPLAVGGTSLYIKALSEGLFAGPAADEEFRNRLKEQAELEGSTALHAELVRLDPKAAEKIGANDLKRIIRALEVHRATGRPISDQQGQWDAGVHRYDCVFIGLRRAKEDLSHRINLRVRKMVEAGLRDEVAALMGEPAGLSPQAAQAVGYAEMIGHLAGRCSFDQAVEQIKINTRKLAKKQRTWHRRWTDVKWFDLSPDETADATVERILKEMKFG
ncbi:MAG: tRNA (adenosine(37)-N6)-dimethylallyltransferase MiaA [Planctomycetes bacterium]|nr:tRNA (adenosine(37)-N6)-dimethylallyltransferase MiaA [Planctomycetota bacterium]